MLYVISAQTLLDNLKDNLYETNSYLLREISIKDLSFSQFEKIIDLLVEKKLANVISKLYIIGPVPQQWKQWGNPMALKALPKNIGQLTGLIHFACCNHDVREVPEEIGYCSLLKSLNLYNNDIYVLPLTLGNCSYLEHIVLTMNPYTLDPTLGLREIAYKPGIQAEWRELIAPYRTLACRLPLDLAHQIMIFTEYSLLSRVKMDLMATSVEKSITWLATNKPKKELEAHIVKKLENTLNVPSEGEVQACAQKHGIPEKSKKL